MTGAGKTILIVEDDAPSREVVRLACSAQNHTLIEAANGVDGLAAAREQNPDLIILDINLPGMSGLDVCRRLRSEGSRVPIIMLTAKADTIDVVVGLELGADDYVTKPFSPKELVARVRAVLRRAQGMERQSDIVRVGTDVELDVPKMEATIGDRRIDLTRTEFELLATMARQPGRIFTRAQLLSAIRGVAFESYERAIDAHVKNIRRKIEPDPRAPRYLLTAYGVGYRFADAPR